MTRILLTLVLASFTLLATAQSGPSASFNDDFQVVLTGDTDVPAETYKIDISHMAFDDESRATKFFAGLASNLEQYKLDFENDMVYLTLMQSHLGNTKWDIAQWNDYFAERADHYRRVHDAVMGL